jgi:hypothetical protein
VNTAQWLNWQCGIGTVAAREKVRVARALEHLPLISASFGRGELSYSKVRAMTRVASPANESALVTVALHGTAAHVEKLVRKYRWTERRDAGRLAHKQYLARHLTYFYDGTGELCIHARLPAELGAIVRKALETAADVLRESPASHAFTHEPTYVPAETCSDERLESAGARRADALRYLAETFLARRAEDVGVSSAADRYQLVVHIDEAILADDGVAAVADTEPHRCELDDGPAISIDTARRLACDATIVRMIEDADGEPLNVGRKTRSIPPALSRALRARDGGCRFPGCDRTRFTHGHHVQHWANGGETKPSNVVTLCGFHHRLVHEGGFGVTATDDGVFVFTRPDGGRIPERGESFRGNISAHAGQAPRDATFEETLRIYTLNEEAGHKIDANTSRCRWLGERMDYSMAIEGMQFLRDRAAAAAVD